MYKQRADVKGRRGGDRSELMLDFRERLQGLMSKDSFSAWAELSSRA